MEKVRRAVAIEVESPPLELQTAARGVYHPWVGGWGGFLCLLAGALAA
jgi:hypothetical protein